MIGPQTASARGTQAQATAARQSAHHHSPLQSAIDQARRCLLDLQRRDGHWIGELQGDTILESEFIMLMAFLGRDRDRRIGKAARYILDKQIPGGGWNNYPGGPPALSVSVKAYFALKLAGHDPLAPYMKQARGQILQLGGAAGCDSFTSFYLALLGQLPYESCPAVPPEIILLPRWAWFSIYAMSSWTRTIVIPLTIFYAHRPVRRLAAERGIAELFLEDPAAPRWPLPPTRQWVSWTNLFLTLDYLVKRVDRWLGPIRRLAVKRAKAWMLERFRDSDGLGAIFPPIIYTIVSLRCLGYADDSREMRWAVKQLDDLVIEDDTRVRVQPCFSPVWDTALSLIALADAGQSAYSGAVDRGVRWLLEKEVRRPGDWSIANPGVEPAGWFFEYQNAFYPDTDDTAMVLMALARSGHAVRGPKHRDSDREAAVDLSQLRLPVDRGIRWLVAMQNRDGGWAAFDREINNEILTKVPFADHNAMLDPSCPDITGRVLEALGHYGFKVGNPMVDRAILFLAKTQEPHGGWLGRWGVNYIYGTWQVLVGLNRAGYDMQKPMVHNAVAWLKSVQQASGGWGESCRSYDDPSLAGQGATTASQTAWALLGLAAAGESCSPHARAGIKYLLSTQEADGNWREEEFTGTGFPKVFYLKYHMYSLYFPLMALARHEACLNDGSDSTLQKEDSHALSSVVDDHNGRLHGQKDAAPRKAFPSRSHAGTAARV